MKKLAAYVAFFHHGEQMKSLPKTAIQRALVAIGPSVYPIYGAERIFGVCFNAPPGSAPASSAKLRGELGRDARVLVIEIGEDFQDWAYQGQHDLSQTLKIVLANRVL